MIIGGKSALFEPQLLDRKNKGADFIEIHSLPTDFEDIKSTVLKKKLLNEIGLTAYAFHVPFCNLSGYDCALSAVDAKVRKDNFEILRNSIYMANELCDVNNPIVILHSGGLFAGYTDGGPIDKDVLKSQKNLFCREILELDYYLKHNYPNIIAAVENMPKFYMYGNTEAYSVYGYNDDICRWIEELHVSNIGTTLDICHAMATCNYNLDINDSTDLISIDSFLKTYISTLKLIHLAKGYNYIISDNEHAQPFLPANKEDTDFLRNIFSYLHKNNYTHPITIETLEDDLLNAENYKETKKAIDIVLNTII